CDFTCDGICQACDGSTGGPAGTCTFRAALTTTAGCSAGQGCTSANCACDGSGHCDAANGDVCPVTHNGVTCASGHCSGDDICWATGCAGACQSCAGGTTCNVVTNMQNPTSCDDSNGCGFGRRCTCDGSGNCKRKNGETCTTPADCATGNCAGGVCCSS